MDEPIAKPDSVRSESLRASEALLTALANDLQPQLIDKLLPLLVEHLTPRIADRLQTLLAERMSQAADSEKPWKKNLFIPSMDVYRIAADNEFMAYSTCSSRDFLHPEFKRITQMANIPSVFHRKYWEWVFIPYRISSFLGNLSGKRGLGFGVGNEPLSALFAKLGAEVTATDAPEAIGVASGWHAGGQFSSGANSLLFEGIVTAELFQRFVSFRECDMTAIPDDLADYDFCWSSCCLEHLGSLRAGLDFVIKTVESTLRIGGVACHTTEFNLSSNEDTVESGPTVIYRRRDIEQFIDELRNRGHEVQDLRIAPDSLVIDYFVDTPPYLAPPHLKLSLLGFTSTSMGLVIRRGR